MAPMNLPQQHIYSTTFTYKFFNTSINISNQIDNFFHQAAGKALRAVQLAKDAKKDFNSCNNLHLLSSNLHNIFLDKLVSEFEELVKSVSHLKYPNYHVKPLIPHDVYKTEAGNRAHELSQQILRICSEYID